MKSKKVAIFFYEGYISAAPTILNLCSFFSEKDINVTLFTRTIQEKYNQDKSCFHFDIIYLDNNYFFGQKIILSLITRLLKKNHRKIYNSLVYLINSFSFIKSAKKISKDSHSFDKVFGVDPIGLIAAHNFNSKPNSLVYLSLEINYLFNNSNIYTNWIKKIEKKIHLTCSFTIIQDNLRLKK